MALYAPGGKDRRLHVAWGAVGPFGRRGFLTLEPSGQCNIEKRDLQDPTQAATYRLDFSDDAVRAIWDAIAKAYFKDRSVVTDTVDGDFIEVAIEEEGDTTVTLLRNGYHRPTLVFIGFLNGYLPDEVQVTYSLLSPAVLAVRSTDT
jgi:hypothetical protein